jgi:DNA-binding LacI/PurR family transcriptional regulator
MLHQRINGADTQPLIMPPELIVRGSA